jgi:hypothetical protein
LVFAFFQTNFNDPIELKYLKCGTKIIASPKEADKDEILENPCIIKLTKEGSFVGTLVDYFIFLNGKKIAKIGNKKTIEIETNIKNNLLFLTDDSGTAFGDYFNFETVSGSMKELSWHR